VTADGRLGSTQIGFPSSLRHWHATGFIRGIYELRRERISETDGDVAFPSHIGLLSLSMIMMPVAG
jgi:hypothetical protein